MTELSEVHFGARMRWRCIYEELDLDVHSAMKARQQERVRPFDLQDRRDFFRGWRLGKAKYAIDDLQRYLNYAKSDEIEEIADELWAIARKHGLALSDREMTERYK